MKRPVFSLAAACSCCLLALALSRPGIPASASAPIQSQSEMNAQAYADYRKADAELNRVYARLTKKLDKEGVTRLKRTQRAWIAFRDAEMAFAEDSARGGTMMPLLRFGAALQMTTKRTEDLNQYLTEYGER